MSTTFGRSCANSPGTRHHAGPRRGFVTLALVLVMTLFSACGNSSDSNADPAPADSAQAASPPTVTLLPPNQQEGGSLAVRVESAAGQPVTDATVRLEGDMTHAGMVPVISDPVSHERDGIYRVPFEFTMLGDWIISVHITTRDGAEYSQQIEIGVNEEGMEMP